MSAAPRGLFDVSQRVVDGMATAENGDFQQFQPQKLVMNEEGEGAKEYQNQQQQQQQQRQHHRSMKKAAENGWGRGQVVVPVVEEQAKTKKTHFEGENGI